MQISNLIKPIVKKFFHKIGYEINAYNFFCSHDVRRAKFINDQNISLVIDVGANEGQYALMLRSLGYQEKIISFEPVKQVFNKLAQKSELDRKWIVNNQAIGDYDGETEINISSFSQVSSILSATGIANTNYWKAQSKETIAINKLDSLIDTINIENNSILLKIDTQGFEDKVLKGSENLLAQDNIKMLEIELSLQPFYQGEKLLPEMFNYIRNLGFELISMNPVHINSIKGYVLQYDCIFLQKEIFRQ